MNVKIHCGQNARSLGASANYRENRAFASTCLSVRRSVGPLSTTRYITFYISVC